MGCVDGRTVLGGGGGGGESGGGGGGGCVTEVLTLEGNSGTSMGLFRIILSLDIFGDCIIYIS